MLDFKFTDLRTLIENSSRLVYLLNEGIEAAYFFFSLFCLHNSYLLGDKRYSSCENFKYWDNKLDFSVA